MAMKNERKIVVISLVITILIQFMGVTVLGYLLSPDESGAGCGGAHSNFYDCGFPEVVEVIILQVLVLNLGSVGLVSFFIFMVAYLLLKLIFSRSSK